MSAVPNLLIKFIDFEPITSNKTQTIAVDVINTAKVYAKLSVSCNDGFSQQIDVNSSGVYTISKPNTRPDNICTVTLSECTSSGCTVASTRTVRYIYTQAPVPYLSPSANALASTYLAPGDYSTYDAVRTIPVIYNATPSQAYSVASWVTINADAPPIIASVCIGAQCRPMIHIGNDAFKFSSISGFSCTPKQGYNICLTQQIGSEPTYAHGFIGSSAGLQYLQNLIAVYNRRIGDFVNDTGLNLGTLTVADKEIEFLYRPLPDTGRTASMMTIVNTYGNAAVDELCTDNGCSYFISGYGHVALQSPLAPVVIHVFPYYNNLAVDARIDVHMNYVAFKPNCYIFAGMPGCQ